MEQEAAGVAAQGLGGSAGHAGVHLEMWRELEADYQMGRGQGRPEAHLVCHT